MAKPWGLKNRIHSQVLVKTPLIRKMVRPNTTVMQIAPQIIGRIQHYISKKRWILKDWVEKLAMLVAAGD